VPGPEPERDSSGATAPEPIEAVVRVGELSGEARVDIPAGSARECKAEATDARPPASSVEGAAHASDTPDDASAAPSAGMGAMEGLDTAIAGAAVKPDVAMPTAEGPASDMIDGAMKEGLEAAVADTAAKPDAAVPSAASPVPQQPPVGMLLANRRANLGCESGCPAHLLRRRDSWPGRPLIGCAG
jgi:hypothetical protein